MSLGRFARLQFRARVVLVVVAGSRSWGKFMRAVLLLVLGMAVSMPTEAIAAQKRAKAAPKAARPDAATMIKLRCARDVGAIYIGGRGWAILEGQGGAFFHCVRSRGGPSM
jgi:hypothetical protein